MTHVSGPEQARRGRRQAIGQAILDWLPALAAIVEIVESVVRILIGM
ncbi:hypothetical protein [Streptomyces sp. MS1.AVA.4]|uniref:Uncharacterized protein n=1 Tax=Streptomyces pratisoli TaxID=3139917 RepID=A0ACC6QV92_9ACTN